MGISTSSEIHGELKRLHSPDIFDLAGYQPSKSDSFGFLLQILAGPEGEKGEESFDVLVCTPKWLTDRHTPDELIVGLHYLFVFEYNYTRIERFVADYCRRCEGRNWQEVASKIGRLGKWEFEDYDSSAGLGR